MLESKLIDIVPIKRALISVTDKTNLELLVKPLLDYGVHILSSGGTAQYLQKHHLPFQEVSDYTGCPEMLDGRVKTLHPKIHSGILAIRSCPQHQQQMQDQNYSMIDLVVVNLYAFEQAAQSGDIDFLEVVEQIDVGGPTLLRAAAKNYPFVTVLTAPSQYADFLTTLAEYSGSTPLAFRKQLAAQAFARTSAYDASITHFFYNNNTTSTPSELRLAISLKQSLRYGENPHQGAGYYLPAGQNDSPLDRVVQGKALSYNNINDADAAVYLMRDFVKDPAFRGKYIVGIFKHANPCGVGVSQNSLLEAYQRALAGDSISAFGGILVFSHPLDQDTAKHCLQTFAEVILAPSITAPAQVLLASKKNLRVLICDFDSYAPPNMMIKPALGGYLVQTADDKEMLLADCKVVTKRSPSPDERQALLLAWKVAKHVKSNAIVITNTAGTLGIGAGQMSRVDATWIAAKKMQDYCYDAEPCSIRALASDAFFPFADSIDYAHQAKVTAIIQPGGSIKDSEVIEAADSRNMAMILTGIRHFRHG